MTNKQLFLQKIVNTAHKIDHSAIIILYGSRARGDSKPDSDWDFLILTSTNPVNDELERKFKYPLFDLELETGEIISSLIYPASEWESKYRITPLYYNIKNEGIIL